MGDEGRLTLEPEAAAAPEPEALLSGPDSAPEVRGEAARGEACRCRIVSATVLQILRDRMLFPMECSLVWTDGWGSFCGRSAVD